MVRKKVTKNQFFCYGQGLTNPRKLENTVAEIVVAVV